MERHRDQKSLDLSHISGSTCKRNVIMLNYLLLIHLIDDSLYRHSVGIWTYQTVGCQSYVLGEHN